MRYLVILVVACSFFSCEKNCSRDVPDCVNSKIEWLKTQPKGNPAYSVFQYDYNGHKVYYFPPQCCDQFSDLFDENCEVICHPDGGIAGGGDGSCRDFFSSRQNEVLIWKDNR